MKNFAQAGRRVASAISPLKEEILGVVGTKVLAQKSEKENFTSFFKRVADKLESKGINPDKPFMNK